MKTYRDQIFEGERALFDLHDAQIEGCHFLNGESPLKEGSDLSVAKSIFSWKYPLWYCKNVRVNRSKFEKMARAGIWYTNNMIVTKTRFISPKMFRKCKELTLVDVKFKNGVETLWWCEDVRMTNIESKGDYFLMNSRNIVCKNLKIDGNYPFDGCENVEVYDSILNSKDAFWNCRNVYLKNCTIRGEYLAWNSMDVTMDDCIIESLQGLCYVKHLVMHNCTLNNTTLAFEYSTIDAHIDSKIDSVKNPRGGYLECLGIGELIMEKDKVQIDSTQIVIKEEEK